MVRAVISLVIRLAGGGERSAGVQVLQGLDWIPAATPRTTRLAAEGGVSGRKLYGDIRHRAEAVTQGFRRAVGPAAAAYTLVPDFRESRAPRRAQK